jgi:hypothetical protein
MLRYIYIYIMVYTVVKHKGRWHMVQLDNRKAVRPHPAGLQREER